MSLSSIGSSDPKLVDSLLSEPSGASDCKSSPQTETGRQPLRDSSETRGARLKPRDDPSAVRPLLRWVGGKKWLVREFPQLFDIPYVRYLEPFLGGASLFLHADPSVSVISDSNRELMDCYYGVARDANAVWEHYSRLVLEHSPDHYLRLRRSRPTSRTERAARLLYLNRSCFNGIYRVNRAGDFNVPLGSPRFRDLTEESLVGFSVRLRQAELTSGDFESITSEAQAGDLLVLDPPYCVDGNRENFVRYNERVFSWSDQERLASEAKSAAERGVSVIATNAAHPSILKLYPKELFTLRRLSRTSAVASRNESRGRFSELLIKSRGAGSDEAA